MTDLSIFKDFPRFPFADEFCVPVVEFRGITIKEGMWAVWMDDPQPFRIEAIRLNPCLRFWTGKDWAIAANCRIV